MENGVSMLVRSPLRAVSFISILVLSLFSMPIAIGSASQSLSPNAMAKELDGSLVSTNWSGYAVNGSAGSITAAQGSWQVAKITCPTSGATYSAFWVGIDGFQSSTVEQTGTDSDCHNGTPSYYAWYEFYPNPSVKVTKFAVYPGDYMKATVSFSNGVFKITIKDATTGLSYSKSATVSQAARSSAEFIVETPLVCKLLKCGLASLSNFGTVGFGQTFTGIQMSCGLVKAGVQGSIGSFGAAVQEITMVSQSNHSQAMAQPSPLTSDGTSFTVQWVNSGP